MLKGLHHVGVVATEDQRTANFQGVQAACLDRVRVQEALREWGGILRAQPCWVTRSFIIPGRKSKLLPDDLYAFGAAVLDVLKLNSYCF
jgi:hypothetical protein